MIMAVSSLAVRQIDHSGASQSMLLDFGVPDSLSTQIAAKSAIEYVSSLHVNRVRSLE
jgi:hypothetical protein